MHRDQRRSIVEFLERRFLLSTVTYNRTAAVAYANKYWDEVASDGYFWINGSTEVQYTPGSPVPVNVTVDGQTEDGGIGDDCAHFVSSCIGQPPGGGAGGLTIPSRTDSYGEPGAARLDELLVGNSAGGYGTKYEYGELVSSVSQLQPGDVIGYVWGTTTGTMADIDHTVIYMGNGLVDAHAASHSDIAWNSLDSVFTAFFIHINTAGPATPANSSPANNAVVATLTPKLTASAFSETSGTQAAADWQILEGTTVVYDTGTDTSDKTSLTVPAGKLSNDTSYTWDVRYEDTVGNWSSYSTATSFAVTIGPYTPVNSSPANNASLYNSVALNASAFSDTLVGATHTASEWVVKNSSGTDVYDSGTDTTDLLSDTVSTDLPTGQTYTWQVRYEDNAGYWSLYSTATSFTVPPPSALTLGSAAAYYLQDSADGQSLNIWDAATDTGTPAQTVPLAEITSILIEGVSTGSNISIDFADGGPSPGKRITVLATGNASNNTLNILGSASGNDTVSFFGGQYTVNGTVITYASEGTTFFTPGTGSDSLSIAGTFTLGTTPSGNVNLSSLSVPDGSTLNIGSDIVNLFYTAGNDPDSTIQALVSTAYNGNTWTGTGLTSSLAAANPTDSAVGYYDNGSSIVIRATWKGDANCDGVLNADDLSVMALALVQKKTDWSAGNFNYDSQINADDAMVFDYSVAYANGRNYTTVFAPDAALQSAAQMSQVLSST